jgi:5-methylcytosine-specific restriction endonuclease McrA
MTIRYFAGGATEQRALMAWRVLVDAEIHNLTSLGYQQIHDRQHGRCYLCLGAFVHERGPSARLARSRDHVFPRTAGGGGLANILLAHRVCNERKGNRWPTPCEVLFLASVYLPPTPPASERALRRRYKWATRRT